MTVSRRTSGRVLALLGLLSLLLTGCGSEDQAPASSTAAAPEGEPYIEVVLANADQRRGQMLYFQCRACHSLNEGGPNKVGPNLWNMFGSTAGFALGFAYSDAFVDSDIVWTTETVSAWLHRPSRFLPGNRMVFVGVKDAQDRANLIAFLQQQTVPAAE